MLIALFRDPSSTLLADRSEDLKICARALEFQLNEQFAPAWDCAYSHVEYLERADDWPVLMPHAFPLVIYDRPDVSGAAGYHTKLQGKVFASIAFENGSDVLTGPYALSSTICHEGIEMRGNKAINAWFDVDASHETAGELCDAVEHDNLIVDLDGTKVQGSNFLLPSWFDVAQAGSSGPFDFLGSLQFPFKMTDGGYMIMRNKDDGTEHPVFGESYPEWKKAHKIAHGRVAIASRLLRGRNRLPG